MNNVRLLKRTWCSTVQGRAVLWARLCHHTWSALGLPPRPHLRSVPGLLAFLINSTPMPHGLCTCCFCICILYGSHQSVLYSKAIYSERPSLTTIKIPHPVLPSPLTLSCFFSLHLSFERKGPIYLCICLLCAFPV